MSSIFFSFFRPDNPQYDPVTFASIERLQPFHISVSSNVLLLVDFHCHLSKYVLSSITQIHQQMIPNEWLIYLMIFLGQKFVDISVELGMWQHMVRIFMFRFDMIASIIIIIIIIYYCCIHKEANNL